MRRLVKRQPGCGFSLLLVLVAALSVSGILVVLPMVRCPACKGAHGQRMGYLRLPGIAPDHAAAIRAWAESDRCELCDNRDRVSLLTSWQYPPWKSRPW
jgi:hypothetical protein